MRVQACYDKLVLFRYQGTGSRDLKVDRERGGFHIIQEKPKVKFQSGFYLVVLRRGCCPELLMVLEGKIISGEMILLAKD